MDYMTLKEASEKSSISCSTGNYYCAGRIFPAPYQDGNNWLIPKDAEKPVDMRTKQGRKRMKPYKVLLIEDDLNPAENICKFLSNWAKLCPSSTNPWQALLSLTPEISIYWM